MTTNSNRELRIPGRDMLTVPETCSLLRQAKIRNCDLVSNGSNYVFLVTLVKQNFEFKAIYKPQKGEVPLLDFPEGTLYKREYAAFILSEALEWSMVPSTVIRSGPYGAGSMQWFIDTTSETSHHLPIKDTILKQVALFDYLINNADRKLGHFLLDGEKRLWLVDHGLTFNAEPKLRTVLWNFARQTVPDDLLKDVRLLRSKLESKKQLRNTLGRLLDKSELTALEFRINAILEKPVFVSPGLQRSIPWPWY
jgi:Phosphatidylinositol 3- and 4-kinase